MVQMSKSGARDRTTRKVRHAPEVMAAGKKLAKKNPEETMSSEKEARKDANKPRSFLISTRAQSVSLLLSGTQEKLDHEFPGAAASDKHSRPQPAIEKPHTPRAFLIQQPRKC